MSNLENKINAKCLEKLTQPAEPTQTTCNCKDKPSCQLNSEYLFHLSIHCIECKRKRNLNWNHYGQLKNRYRNHTALLKDKNKRNATKLSININTFDVL